MREQPPQADGLAAEGTQSSSPRANEIRAVAGMWANINSRRLVSAAPQPFGLTEGGAGLSAGRGEAQLELGGLPSGFGQPA